MLEIIDNILLIAGILIVLFWLIDIIYPPYKKKK